MALSKKRSTQTCLKHTAGLAAYGVTEGQQLDVPSVHPELRSRAGSFALLEIDLRSCLPLPQTGVSFLHIRSF
jgi:hypothetical protein